MEEVFPTHYTPSQYAPLLHCTQLWKRDCENEEVNCGQQDRGGVEMCVLRTRLCDRVPNNSSHTYDEIKN